MLQLLRLRRRKDESYSFEHSFEAGDLALQMFLACGCDPVGAYSAIGKGNLPLRLNLALFQEALQRRIERAFFDLKKLVGPLLDVLHKRVAMHGMTLERLKHHHLQCSSKQISLFGFPCECHRPIQSKPSVKQCTRDVNTCEALSHARRHPPLQRCTSAALANRTCGKCDFPALLDTSGLPVIRDERVPVRPDCIRKRHSEIPPNLLQRDFPSPIRVGECIGDLALIENRQTVNRPQSRVREAGYSSICRRDKSTE